jgi:uncharacterized protein (DUF1697 family)
VTARLAAFLRAVNVGGTGKLPMPALKAMGEAVGFKEVRTYIASGNVVFETKLGASAARQKLLARLETHFGKAAEFSFEMLRACRLLLMKTRSLALMARGTW